MIQSMQRKMPRLIIQTKRKYKKKTRSKNENKTNEEIGKLAKMEDCKEDEENQGSSEDETDHGHSSNTNCSVFRYTLNEGNKRGDWMKHWLMLQGYTALNTIYRKTHQKQTTFVSPKGNEKQIDCILTKRRYLRYNKDAEANDMIHMGSDHRCVTGEIKQKN